MLQVREFVLWFLDSDLDGLAAAVVFTFMASCDK